MRGRCKSKIAVVTGGTSKICTLNIKNAIIKGTHDGNNNLVLSKLGRSCLYHTELPNGVTDIVLVNTSNGTLYSNERVYSVNVCTRYSYTAHRVKSDTCRILTHSNLKEVFVVVILVVPTTDRYLLGGASSTYHFCALNLKVHIKFRFDGPVRYYYHRCNYYYHYLQVCYH